MSAETKMIALEEISADKAPVIYGHNKLADYVAKAREAVVGEVPDLKTRKGRERIASLAAAVSRSKTAVEKPGRDYLKRLKEMPKAIEAELREFTQQMDALRDEVRKPLDDWEAAERDRIAGHQECIGHLKDCAALLGDESSETLVLIINQVESAAIDQSWQEFEAEAHRVKASTLETLRAALDKRLKHEAEQAELAELRRQQAERDTQDERDRIAREAAERATREAEQRAQADRDAAAQRERDLELQAERAQRENLEAQQRAEQAERDAQAKADAAAAAERQRQADEQARLLREADAREADKAHKAKINSAALEAFIAGGMPEECAKQAVILIARRAIPNVSITY